MVHIITINKLFLQNLTLINNCKCDTLNFVCQFCLLISKASSAECVATHCHGT